MSPYPVLSVGPYPNSALSAGQMIMIAMVMLLALAVWLIGVFAADRAGRRQPNVATTSLPTLAQAGQEEPAPPVDKVAA